MECLGAGFDKYLMLINGVTKGQVLVTVLATLSEAIIKHRYIV